MKKMTFNVKTKEDFSLFPLIKEINLLSCRISINLEGGVVEVEDVDEQQLESVIDSVANQFNILSVKIDNVADIHSINVSEVTSKHEEETSLTENSNQPTEIEPQSENDLIIKKVEFENELIEEALNKLAKTAYWALYKANVSEKDIERYFLSCKSEISMEYETNKIINFKVGDIVDCNFGMHLTGEAQGAHILAIVCKISNRMACVVPISKTIHPKLKSNTYVAVNFNDDVDFDSDANLYYKDFSNGFAILGRAKFVRFERFRLVIGHVKPAFFEKLLEKLAKYFDFTGSTEAIVDNTDVAKTVEVSESLSTEKPEKKKIAEKISTEETALLEAIGPALEHLRTNVTPTIQAASFANEIGFDTSNKYVIESFVYACNVKKINYENIVAAISAAHNGMNEKIIKMQLKDAFKDWLFKHPEIAEKCPKISITSLLKVFAKKFKTDN